MKSNQEILDRIWPGWKVESKLGRGAFGVVYKISREVMDQKAERAMKVMHIPTNPSEVASLDYMDMDESQIHAYFEKTARNIANEYMIMETLKSAPNIVQVDEAEVIPDDDGIGWTILIRMELLEPIRTYHKRTGFPDENEVIRIGMNICSALEYCGMKNIIHRDIKPENVFRNEFGLYKLGDFGISRQLENSQSMHSKKGTVSYMAPEVYYGCKYDETVDIYSLGLMLYRYLNRQRLPFVPTDHDVTPQILEEASIRRFSGEKLQAPVDASPELASIILKACEAEPSRRFQSAKAFRDALAKCLKHKEAAERGEKYSVFDQEETLLLSELEKQPGLEGNRRGNQFAGGCRQGGSHASGSGQPGGQKYRLALIVVATILLLLCASYWINRYSKGSNSVNTEESANNSGDTTKKNEDNVTESDTDVMVEDSRSSAEEDSGQDLQLPSLWNDEVLEAMIREIAQNTDEDLEPEDIREWTELDLQLDENAEESQKIKDIRDLEGMKNLALLDLSYHKISDISPLANLTGLEKLYLNNNHLSDIRVLSELYNLKELFVYGNDINREQIKYLQDALPSCEIHVENYLLYDLPDAEPDEYYYFNDHTYAFYDALRYGFTTYDEVSEFCHNQGGHLAVINDRSENSFLYNLMKENYKITVFFGYTDKDDEGNWVWDGDESDYENWTRSGDWNLPDNGESWGGGEWKNGGEDYAEFNYDRDTNWGAPNDTTWNDATFMENTTIFFCEWEFDMRKAEAAQN